MSNLSQKLKLTRKLKNITQEAMAKKLKMPRNTYTAKEIRRSFNQEELEKISQVLGIQLDELINEMVTVPDEQILQVLVDLKAIASVSLSFQAEILAELKKNPVSTYLNSQTRMVADEARKIWGELRS